MSIAQIPVIPDVKAEDPLNVRDVLVAIKEVLEVMLARRGTNEDLWVVFVSALNTFNAISVVGDLTAGTIQAGNGWTGSWVNNEGDTVTVVGGIITDVS